MGRFLKEDIDKQLKELEDLKKEFNELLDKYSLKLVNQILAKSFTQLSYLDKIDREVELSFPKVIIYKNFIKQLNGLMNSPMEEKK